MSNSVHKKAMKIVKMLIDSGLSIDEQLIVLKQELERGITITHVDKQETHEEAAEKYYENNKFKSDYPHCFESFKDGAKWQQERSYSEEDMLNFAWFLKENLGQYSCDKTAHFEGKYFEQFKNK